MCGIGGVLEFEPDRKPSLDGLRRLAQVLRHRGPDEEGFFRSGPVGLAHRRLSIIDLAGGQQPMQSADGQVCVVFNGEIYNYPELQNELAHNGYLCHTRSDTEVLLALYLRYGVAAFAKLNGMFACAFWDGRERKLVLARDRVGKKPLFYYQDGRRFLFASELKALLAYGGIERRVSSAALHEYLTYNYIAGEETILAGVRRLPPAHFMTVRSAGRVESRRYWEFRFQPPARAPDENEAVEQLGTLLRQAVKRRMLSDVPLGAFLSGGLDSSTVVALMAQLSTQPVRTFAVGFEDADFSELDDARAVAKHIGTDHQEIMVRPATLDILRDLVWHLDEPFGDSSAVPTYYVCRAARQHLTVALSGDGGDEVFAGYNLYRQLDQYRCMERIPKWVRRGILRPLGASLPFTWPGWNRLYALGRWPDGGLPCSLGIYPWIQEKLYSPEFLIALAHSDPFATLNRLLAEAAPLDPISRYQYVDTLQYLPADILTKVDRMSMANSLEVRAPLLDYTVVEYAATLPASLKLRDGVSKYILRKVCSDLLPARTLNKRKQGFAIPQGRWLQHDLRILVEDVLLDRRTLTRGYFREDMLRLMLAHHATGRRDYSTWIWCLIMLEMWFRIFLDPSQIQVDEHGWQPGRVIDRPATLTPGSRL